MDALAAEAFLNAEHEVFGLKLLPLSLGHAFTLEAIGNPFYHGRLGTEQELRVAVWVCSRPPLFIPKMDGKDCAKWLEKKFEFVDEASKWAAYVADYCAPPQFWNKAPKAGEERSEPSGIPNNISTAVRLMRLGFTEQQAWATPVGAAAWYEAAAYENDFGRLDIVTDAERMAIMRQKKREEAAENG